MRVAEDLDGKVSFDSLLGVEATISGNVGVNLSRDCDGTTKLCLTGGASLGAFAGGKITASVSAKSTATQITYSGALDGQLGMEGTLSAEVHGCDSGLTFTLCGQVSALSHLTGSLKAKTEDGSAEGSIDIKDIGLNADTVIASVGNCNSAGAAALAMHAADGDDNGTNLVEVIPASQFLRPPEEVNAALEGSQPQAQSGVCAKVRLQLDQQAILSRDAFKATLELDNQSGVTLQGIQVDVTIKDSNGNVATNLFVMQSPSVNMMSGVDGTGTLAAGTTGTASWMLLPTVDAALTNAQQYFVGGTLHYLQDGTAVAVPMAAAPITVYPLPQLRLDYFQQRDVYSDDPFTRQIEPSLPYSLAVMVRNDGYGVARDFRISSAQPQIIENERGLLIDFKIIATEVAGRSLSPSLTVDFGDIQPQSILIGNWLFTSSLQGFFSDYKAVFENLDLVGNKRLALVTNVSIHEMIHLVQAQGALEDEKPDFLVDDIPNERHLPDKIYLSDGTTNPVSVVEQANIDTPLSPEHLQVLLTAPMVPGWTYLRMPDPGNGVFTLLRVVRSDGLEIYFNTNVWTTDRTFIGLGRRPVSENILHLLDHDSPGTYALYYTNAPAPDTIAPTSSVTVLPATNYSQFNLSWSGQDETNGSGLAYFDIFVSSNGGPFQLWLAQTTSRGAVFSGKVGTYYQFYSVATDNAGNRQLPPSTPDAETTVSLTNHPPSLAVQGVITVDEGQLVTISCTATDSDFPGNLLTFSLGADAPPTATIDPRIGTVTWQTGETDGPGTNAITIVARDNGIPSLSATSTVTVIVREVNAAPSLAPIADYKINEGEIVRIINSATDIDIPKQHLTYYLGAGAPAGASMDPNSGIFTWRPNEYQGGTTNRILVIVSDDGPGNLTATQNFNVVVRDTRSDFVISIGSTNVFVGETKSVPIQLASGADLSSIQLDLTADGNFLTGLGFRDLTAELNSTQITPTGPDQSQVTMTAKAAEVLQGNLYLAQLNFTSVSNEHSAIAFIQASSVTGTRRSGSVLGNGRGVNGRVFIIGKEPILDLQLSTNGTGSLSLYGHTNQHYLVEYSTNLMAATSWTLLSEVEMTSPLAILPNLPLNTQTLFYRARERLEDGTPFIIQRAAEGAVIIWSGDCASCVLEESSALGPSGVWTPASFQPQLTNGTYRVNLPPNNSSRYYRLKKR